MADLAPVVEKRGDVTCILLGPEFENLDETSLDMIRQKLLDASVAADPPLVVLDMQYTKFFGSSFIEVLFRIWNRQNGLPNGEFAISGLTDYCLEVLQVTHLDKLWKLCDNVDDAVKQISRK